MKVHTSDAMEKTMFCFTCVKPAHLTYYCTVVN